jgi:DNA polymerase-3 subunit epsilon
MNFVSIDFETANEKRDSACAIGIAVVTDGVVTSHDRQLIRPVDLRFSPYNTAIHGITEDDVESAPSLAELWPEIEHKLRGQFVVAHNASFDMSVLRYSLHSNCLPFPELRYVCSMKIASQAWPGLASYRLDVLAQYRGIALDHHNPESDARAAAEIVLMVGREQSASSLDALADQLDVTVGEISADGSWTPSSAPQIDRGGCAIELSLPDKFDITRHPLYGKSFVFTGAMIALTRSNAEHLVKQVGGCPRMSVSKKTDYLVCGVQDLRMLNNAESESSKLRTAKSLRESGAAIQIIGEDEFLRALTEPCGSCMADDQEKAIQDAE